MSGDQHADRGDRHEADNPCPEAERRNDPAIPCHFAQGRLFLKAHWFPPSPYPCLEGFQYPPPLNAAANLRGNIDRLLSSRINQAEFGRRSRAARNLAIKPGGELRA